MSFIFVSYSRKDQVFVKQLVSDLHVKGVNIWLDSKDIVPGTHWDQAIEEALDKATHVSFVMSKTSVASNNVRDELDTALDAGKIVLPIMMEDCTPPLRARRLQYTDFRTDYAAGVEHLLDILDEEKTAQLSVSSLRAAAAAKAKVTPPASAPVAPVPTAKPRRVGRSTAVLGVIVLAVLVVIIGLLAYSSQQQAQGVLVAAANSSTARQAITQAVFDNMMTLTANAQLTQTQNAFYNAITLTAENIVALTQTVMRPTVTSSPTPSLIASPMASITVAPPSASPTIVPSNTMDVQALVAMALTSTQQVISSETKTPTPSPTATLIPTRTPIPPSATPTITPSSTPVPPTYTPSYTPTVPTPTPIPTRTPIPLPTDIVINPQGFCAMQTGLKLGGYARVSFPGSDNLLFAQPVGKPAANSTASIKRGQIVYLRKGPACASNGQGWWNVQYTADGQEYDGWTQDGDLTTNEHWLDPFAYDPRFTTNLQGWHMADTSIKSQTYVNPGNDGLHVGTIPPDVGDTFFLSSDTDNNVNTYDFEADVTIDTAGTSGHGSAAIVFRSTDRPFQQSYYVAIGTNNYFDVLKYTGTVGNPQVLNATQVDIQLGVTYHLKVVVSGTRIQTYLGNQLLYNEDQGGSMYPPGYLGVLTWDSQVRFQNVIFTPH